MARNNNPFNINWRNLLPAWAGGGLTETHDGASISRPETAAYSSWNNTSGYGQYRHILSVGFDGEKTFGEIGPIRNYVLLHQELRARSWQAYLDSEIAKTVIDKYLTWIIGNGLKLQSNPDLEILAQEGINLNAKAFTDITERRFTLWGNSRNSSHNKQNPLGKLAYKAQKDSIVGGDVLVVLRYSAKSNNISVQLIDGARIQNPPTQIETKNFNGGVELNDDGTHKAYHVRMGNPLTYTRIPAKDPKTGLTMAYLVYGNEFRIDNVRGLPIIAAALETLAKLARYKEAIVGSAEERAKIVYQIVHQNFSTGETPLAAMMAAASDDNTGTDIPTTEQGDQLANKIAVSTKKQVFNMALGSELKALDSKYETHFKEFYQTNADIICSAVGIPPNVAMSIYNDSFSASRAAIMDWQHTINNRREDFSEQFYKPIYKLWLYTQSLMGKLPAPSLVQVLLGDDAILQEAYIKSRWTGPMFPHIDPVKEVNAARGKLGPLFAHLPLTNLENATESVMGGDMENNLKRAAEDLVNAESLGLLPQQSAPGQAAGGE